MELLVVVVIIGIVSAVALPTVLPALQHRQMSEAARILQGALVGARDRAIHDGQPSGIRLLPDRMFDGINPTTGALDPAYPLAFGRIVPIGPAPSYQEGAVTVRPETATFSYASAIHNPDGDPGATGTVLPTLVLEQAVADSGGAPNAPTSWSWNIRLGDQVQINGAGPWYTVIGPAWQPSAEMFVNWGSPGVSPPFDPTGTKTPTEWLLLVDGKDDNANGWADEGWDGVDNNGDGNVDEYNEWLTNMGFASKPGVTDTPPEAETWQGSLPTAGAVSVPYAIRRRPMPTQGVREVALPSDVVIDATTWGLGSPERSRLPIEPGAAGGVDIMVNPDGTAYFSSRYGAPTRFGLAASFFHFWLAERQDVAAPVLQPDPTTGQPAQPPVMVPLETLGGNAHYLPIGRPDGQGIKGRYSLFTLNSRSGRLSVDTQMPFFYDPPLLIGTPPNQTIDMSHPFRGYNGEGIGGYGPDYPFAQAQQGITSAP